VIEGGEIAVYLFGAGKLGAERPNHDDRKFEPFRLVDRHDLDMALGEGLVRVLIFVDPAVIEQPQEAIEEMQPQEFAIAVRYDGVAVVALEGVEELRENREVAGGVLVADGAGEGLKREQVVEIIGGAQVKRLALPQACDFRRPLLKG
jgi:hypothetical protein